MAVTGKNSLTLRKRDLENEKTIGVGFTKLQAWHKAAAGETGIDLLSLNFPSEILGATNPSNAKLAKAQLRKYAANVTITSSLSGKLMRELSYTIPNATRINWVGFTSLQDEIFEITVDYSASTELTVVDGRPLIVTGTLAAGSTDIVVGQPFEAGKNINEQSGAVQVFIDGVQQFRNSNNLASPQDGNYYEVNVGGVSNLIRMNSTSGSDRDYLVMSNGVIAERPTVSQQADIEKVQGQVDAMIPTLAVTAGVPETDFQAAPNNIDLKTFGDRVIQAEIDILGKEDEFSVPFQTKILQSNIAASVDPVSDLTFNNLEIGKTYRIHLQSFLQSTNNQFSTLYMYTIHDGAVIMTNGARFAGNATGNDSFQVSGNATVFTATATTITFDVDISGTSGHNILGNGSKFGTWAQLEELPQHTPTTKWT